MPTRAAKRTAPKRAKAAKRPAPQRPTKAVAAPAPRPAAPAVPRPPAAPPQPVTPLGPPESAGRREAAPSFFEPDDLPSASKPVGAGPFYQNDRRDRPIYDTEEAGAEDEPAALGEEGDTDLGEEDELGEEDDDEDDPPTPRAHVPPAGSERPGARATGGGQRELRVGAVAPDFELRDQRGTRHLLKDYRGRKVVLYFYPKDDTPGCTREACGFRDTRDEFEARGARVLGVSPDSLESHAQFARKYQLTFPLLADEEHAVAERYGVWADKPAPKGRTRRGILRTTFVIDEAGRIAQVFRSVQPEDHERQVLRWLDQSALASSRR